MESKEETLLNWPPPAKGEEVWLYRARTLIASGWIDDVMPDGSGVWVNQHDARGRTMVLAEDVDAILRKRSAESSVWLSSSAVDS